MIGQKIALLFSCLALVAGRTVDRQTATPSTLEGFSGELHIFWKTIFDSSDSGFVKDCKKGKCLYCRSIEKHDVCFIATLEKDSIVLHVALDVFQMTEIVIKDNNPTDICTSPTTDILLINNLCIQIKDANLQRASGCIFVAFEVYREKYSQKVLCFEIPTSDDTSQAL